MTRQFISVSILAGLVFIVSGTLVAIPVAAQAVDGFYLAAKDDPDRDRIQDQDRLRDKSCEDKIERLKDDCEDKLRERDRDRLRDDGDQDRDRDRERQNQ